MLLGSFQNLPINENREGVLISEVPAPIDKDLGFSPIWCFPIEDLETGIFNAITTEPNAPVLFYIFETDDFIKIDKVKHYQNILNDIDADITTCIDESLDNYHAEIIIDRAIATKSTKLLMEVNRTLEIGDNLSLSQLMVAPNIFSHVGQQEVTDCAAEVVDKFKSQVSIGTTLSEDKKMMNLRFNQIAFSLILLPHLIKLVKDKKAYNYWFYACDCCLFENIILATSNFPRWAMQSCNKDEFDRFFEEFKNYLITKDDVLIAYLENSLPKRNDKCLCGSGKKFKKCCGKYLC